MKLKQLCVMPVSDEYLYQEHKSQGRFISVMINNKWICFAMLWLSIYLTTGCVDKTRQGDTWRKLLIAGDSCKVWNIAGGTILMDLHGSDSSFCKRIETAYMEKQRYDFAHKFCTNDSYVDMVYHYEGQDNPGTLSPMWNGDLSNVHSWRLEGNKMLFWGDTFTVVKCTADTLRLMSRRSSIIYANAGP